MESPAVATFLSLTLLSHSLNAGIGSRLNARATGMAGTATAVALGLDAVGINPANLALRDGTIATMTILPIGLNIESDFLTYDMISKYLQKRSEWSLLPESDKESLMESFQTSVGSSSGEAVARLFGITFHASPVLAAALTVDYNFAGHASMPREYARLLLYGNVPGSKFDIQGLSFDAYWARTYTLSFGWLLPTIPLFDWFACGAGVKLIQGYGNYSVDNFSALLQSDHAGVLSGPASLRAKWTTTNSIDHPMGSLFQDPAGYGVGLDVGITGGIGNYASFALSVTDIGSIRWNRDVEELSFDTVETVRNPETFKSIRALSKMKNATRKPGDPYVTKLPGVVRLGAMVQLDKIAGANTIPGELIVAMDFQHTITENSPLAGYQLSFGIEYKPVRWLPIRTGFSYGGNTMTHLAFGLGFTSRHFDLDLATEDLLFLFDHESFSRGSLGFGMRFKIPD